MSTQKKESRKLSVITPEHTAVIDEYFLNGFNGTKAVQSVYNNAYNNARPLWVTINTKAANVEYIKGLKKPILMKAQPEG